MSPADASPVQPRLCMVAARAHGGVIGRDNRLLWHLPRDFAWFKKVTMGKPVLMGRKTFDSIGRPLPGRCNIVLTRRPGWSAEGVTVAHSLDHAQALAREQALSRGLDEYCVIGGEHIYRQALSRCSRIYLTEVDADVGGDTFFPGLEPGEWSEVFRENHSRDESHLYDFSFIVLDRV